MRSIFAGLLLLVAGALHVTDADAQALVYCDVTIAAFCAPSTNPGNGAQGDQAWQAFGKLNANFSFLTALWSLPANTLVGSQGANTIGPITIGANLTLSGGVLSSTGGGGGGGSGTVTTASVVSANGFAGTVATATTTPAFTLSTTITGPLTGNAGALQASTASDIDTLFGCAGVPTTFLNGAGGCTTPAGGGNVSNSGSPTQYQMPVWSASTVLLGIGPGTAGQVLTSGGASAYPSYSSTPPLNLVNATNLQAAALPAFTGDTTTTAGAVATTTKGASTTFVHTSSSASLSTTSTSIVVDSGGGPIALPTAVSDSHTYKIHIGPANTSTVTVNTTSAQTINGATCPCTFSGEGNGIDLNSDSSSNWVF